MATMLMDSQSLVMIDLVSTYGRTLQVPMNQAVHALLLLPIIHLSLVTTTTVSQDVMVYLTFMLRTTLMTHCGTELVV